MIMTTAAKLLAAQQRQLAQIRQEWPAAVSEAISARCAEAVASFDGDWARPRPSYDLDKFFPRGHRFETWLAEFRCVSR